MEQEVTIYFKVKNGENYTEYSSYINHFGNIVIKNEEWNEFITISHEDLKLLTKHYNKEFKERKINNINQ